MRRGFAIGAMLVAIFAAARAHAGCGHDHKFYSEGAIACSAQHLFQCDPAGAWRKLPGRCAADPEPRKSLAPQQPAKPAGTPTKADPAPDG